MVILQETDDLIQNSIDVSFFIPHAGNSKDCLLPQVKTINLSNRYVVILPDPVFDALNYLSFPLQRATIRDMQLYSTDAYNHKVYGSRIQGVEGSSENQMPLLGTKDHETVIPAQAGMTDTRPLDPLNPFL